MCLRLYKISSCSWSCSIFQRAQEWKLWPLCFFQNEDKEKERKRQRELQEGRTNSPKADVDQEEEDYEDNDEEPDDSRQTPENASSSEW